MGQRLRKFLAFLAKQEGVSIRVPGVSLDVSKLAKRAGTAVGRGPLQVFSTATITEPEERSIVAHAVEVKGIVSSVPAGHQLWLAVVPDGGVLHPCRGPVHVHGDSWFGIAYVGTRTVGASTGDQFQIRLVLLSESEAVKWHDYLDEAARTNSWSGVPLVPGNVLAWVNVIRDDRTANRRPPNSA